MTQLANPRESVGKRVIYPLKYFAKGGGGAGAQAASGATPRVCSRLRGKFRGWPSPHTGTRQGILMTQLLSQKAAGQRVDLWKSFDAKGARERERHSVYCRGFAAGCWGCLMGGRIRGTPAVGREVSYRGPGLREHQQLGKNWVRKVRSEATKLTSPSPPQKVYGLPATRRRPRYPGRSMTPGLYPPAARSAPPCTPSLTALPPPRA